MCASLHDEALKAAQALLAPSAPDDLVEDVEPLVSGFLAGCGRYTP